MKEFHLQAEQWLPRPWEEIFLLRPGRQLGNAYSSLLKFEIITPKPVEMHASALIDYRIHVHGFPIRWRTKIIGSGNSVILSKAGWSCLRRRNSNNRSLDALQVK